MSTAHTTTTHRHCHAAIGLDHTLVFVLSASSSLTSSLCCRGLVVIAVVLFFVFLYISLEMPRNKETARHKARRRNSSFSVFFVFVVAHFFRCFRRIDGPSGRWRSAPSSPPAAGQPPAQPCRATRQGRTLCANRGDVPRRRAPRQPADRPSARAARPRAPSSPSITGTVDQRACGRPRRGSERRPPHWA